MGCAQSSGEDAKPGQVAVQQWNPPPKSTRLPLLKLALPRVETSASAAGAGDAATGATDVDGIVGRTPPAVRPRSFGEVGEVQLTSGVLDVGAGVTEVFRAGTLQRYDPEAGRWASGFFDIVQWSDDGGFGIRRHDSRTDNVCTQVWKATASSVLEVREGVGKSPLSAAGKRDAECPQGIVTILGLDSSVQEEAVLVLGSRYEATVAAWVAEIRSLLGMDEDALPPPAPAEGSNEARPSEAVSGGGGHTAAQTANSSDREARIEAGRRGAKQSPKQSPKKQKPLLSPTEVEGLNPQREWHAVSWIGAIISNSGHCLLLTCSLPIGTLTCTCAGYLIRPRHAGAAALLLLLL